MLCLEAVAVCDLCGAEEKVRFRIDHTPGMINIYNLNADQTPDGWRYRRGVPKKGPLAPVPTKLACPKCVDKPDLKVVEANDES